MLRDTRARSWSRRAAIAGSAAVLGTALFAVPASADTYDNDGFESFPLGSPVVFLPGPTIDPSNWTSLDPGVFTYTNFDIAIEDPTSGVWGSTFGNRAMRISNSVISLAFGNQMQSPSLANEAGETAAADSPHSGGTRQTRFAGSLTFASVTQAYQPGLAITISPDEGQGTRMSFFRLRDEPAGLQVSVVYSIPDGSTVEEIVATGLSRTEVHTLEYSIDLADGPNNDVLWLRVGTSACDTWTESGTWETYHRTYGGGDPHPIDSLLFRISTDPGAGNAAALLGKGFYLDDVTYSSSTVPPMPPVGVPGAPGEPEVDINGDTVTVTAPPAATNACVPPSEYTVTLWPIPGGTPLTFTSPTPNFSFPAPPIGNYDVTVSATNSEGTGPESLPGALTVVLAASDDDVIADTGPTAATWPMAMIAATLALLGAGLVVAGRKQRVRA
jgi:hypothetical protein